MGLIAKLNGHAKLAWRVLAFVGMGGMVWAATQFIGFGEMRNQVKTNCIEIDENTGRIAETVDSASGYFRQIQLDLRGIRKRQDSILIILQERLPR